MKKNTANMLKLLAGLAILLIVVKQIGIKKILSTLAVVNLVYLIPVIVIYLFALASSATNVWLFLRSMKKEIQWYTVFRYSVLGWAVGLLTPGKIGESSILYLFKKENIRVGEGAAVVILDKLISLAFIVTCATIWATIFLGASEAMKAVAVFILLVLLGLGCISKKGSNLISRYLPKKYAAMYENFSASIMDILKTQKVLVSKAIGLTMMKWIMGGLAAVLIFMSIGARGNVFTIIIINTALVGLNALPITFHGLGVKEAVGVYAYKMIGIRPEVAVTASIIANILSYGLCIAFIAIYGREFQRVKKAGEAAR